jgi:hypothetical protein
VICDEVWGCRVCVGIESTLEQSLYMLTIIIKCQVWPGDCAFLHQKCGFPPLHKPTSKEHEKSENLKVHIPEYHETLTTFDAILSNFR